MIISLVLLLGLALSAELCTSDVYDSYLEAYPMKCGSDCDEYKKEHFTDFKKSCQHMVSRQSYTPYQMEFTMLSDFSEEDLTGVMDVKQKHSRRGSYYEPIEATEDAVEPTFTTMDRDFCSEDAELREYAKPNNCSLSWVTMIVNAGERALAMIGGSEKLSAAFVKKCYTEGDACNGLGMAEIAEGLKKIGLVSETEANRVLEERGNLCSIPQSKHFTFKVLKAEGPNRGGLMNLIGEGNPVLTLLSIDLNRLRFVKDMREEDVTLSGTVYEPSLYGLVTGYVKTTEEVDGYWVVEGTPSPCESVNVKVPMRDNETNSDYAGIAGYAFAIEFNGKRDFVVPSEGLTSLDAIPSFAQSIVFAANSFSELSEVDFSRFTELKELVFGANSFANVGSLELVGLHKLKSLRFEAGAFANGFNLVLDDLPSLVDLEYSEGCFNGKPSGRRLAEVSGYELHISACISLRHIAIPGGSFTHTTVVSMVSLSAVEEVTIMAGALPKVEVMNMTEIQNVTRISIAPGSLEVCETLVMVDVAIMAENVKDVLNVSRECLKSLNRVMVSSVGSMMELVEDLKEKLGKDVEVDVVTPTSVVPTVVPTSAAPTVAPTIVVPTTVVPTTVAPTTVAPTTVAPTTVAPTTVAPTTVAPTTVAPTTVAPTTVAPTTVAPTTVTPTTVAPTPTLYPITASECWSVTPVPLNVEVITVGNNKCNEANDRIDLSKYFNLKNVSIGNECFFYQDVLNLTGLHSLERVMIGEYSFTKERWRSDANRKLYVKNCDALKELKIGNFSFFDYSVIEIENVNSLELIDIGDMDNWSYNFYYASLELKNLPKLKSLLFGYRAFSSSSRLVLENLPELTSIQLGYSAFQITGINSTLVMRNLPTLTSLETTSGSNSFSNPRHITLYDIPALTTVTLPNAFYYKNDVSTDCNIGELKTFFTDQCKVSDCWSVTPVPLNVEVITVGDNKCNGANDRIDLSKYFNLKNVSIGNDCFYFQDVLNLTGLHSLERVMIGENSFTKKKYYYGNDANRKLYVKNCDALKELKIDRYSFSDYSVIEIENVNSLELIEIGYLDSDSYNFYSASLELKNLLKLKSLLFGNYAFYDSSRLVLENLPELTSIQLGRSAFHFNDAASSTLVMRNLPKLTSLTTTDSYSRSFLNPRHITLYDIPALTTVYLPTAFDYKNDVSTNCNISKLKTFFTDQCPA
ncbi:hypothetical protein WA577_001399 [Blastocystis sp. JDR]